MGVRPACIALLGPTCCWKSEAALRLAEELDGEIVCCGSRQIYRHLAVGTAQVDAATSARVPGNTRRFMVRLHTPESIDLDRGPG